MIEELLQIDDIADRIKIIADDVESRSDQYRDIDPWVLAQDILGLYFSCGIVPEWKTYEAGPKLDLEDQGETPVIDHIGLLFDDSSPHQVSQWKMHIKEFISGKRGDDIQLTPEEKQKLEIAMTKEWIIDGGGWQIQKHTLKGADNSEINFEVCIGDGGDSFNPLGPYQLRDGETNFTSDLVIEEAW